jgi:hypothetical protein
VVRRARCAKIRLLARVVGVGIETADMLVDEVLSRPMRGSPQIVQSRFGLFTASSPWSEARRDRFNEFPHRRQLYPARRSAAERVVYAVVIMNSELVGVLVLWALCGRVRLSPTSARLSSYFRILPYRPTLNLASSCNRGVSSDG